MIFWLFVAIMVLLVSGLFTGNMAFTGSVAHRWYSGNVMAVVTLVLWGSALVCAAALLLLVVARVA